MDGAQLSAHLVSSLDTLRRFLQQTLITEGIQPVAEQIDTLSGHIDQATIKADMEALAGGLTSLAQQVQAGDLSGAAAEIAALERDRKSTRLNSSHLTPSRMPSSA